MEVDPLSLMGVSIALIALIGKHFYYDAAKNTAICERVSKLETQCVELKGINSDVREIKTKVDLFWGAIESQMPNLLMKGNPISPDSKLFEHLQKFMVKQITTDEIRMLVCELEDEAKNLDHSAGEVLAIILMAAVIKSKLTANGGGLWTYS